nr:hypothetical protein [uncultured Brumimicrobium sp.]
MGVENLRNVYWRFDSFVMNMTDESKVIELCSQLESDNDFSNVCLKAKQEVKDLVLSNNIQIIEDYREKFNVCFEILEDWKNKELKDKNKINQINISIGNISDIYRLLVENKMKETLTTFSLFESMANLTKSIYQLDGFKGETLEEMVHHKRVLELKKKNRDEEIKSLQRNKPSKTTTSNFTDTSYKEVLSETQKHVIKKLIKKGFSDVHIYRFLKDEVNFINTTQKDFRSFLNSNYQRDYRIDQRFTALKLISIPVELKYYFDEIKP